MTLMSSKEGLKSRNSNSYYETYIFITRKSTTVIKTFVHFWEEWVSYLYKILKGGHKSIKCTVGDSESQRRAFYKRTQERFVLEAKTS